MTERFIDGPFEHWASHPSGEMDVRLQYRVLFDPPAGPKVVLDQVQPEDPTLVLSEDDYEGLKEQALENYWERHPVPEPDPDREDY